MKQKTQSNLNSSRLEKLITPEIKNIWKDINDAIQKNNELIKAYKDSIIADLKALEDSCSKIPALLKEFIDDLPNDLAIITQYGWFPDLEEYNLGFSRTIPSKLHKGQIEEAEQLLIEYFDLNIESIITELIRRHSKREGILHQILSGYKSELHYLIIPTILNQVDGVCNDIKGKSFFANKDTNHIPRLVSLLDDENNPIHRAYISPIQSQISIFVKSDLLPNYHCKLNRHTVTHGEDYEYGIKINSLKAISLLKYMSDILTDIGTSIDIEPNNV